MTGRRHKSLKLLGTALAGWALSVQLVLASWGVLALAASGDQSLSFGEHALCLTGETGRAAPELPVSPVPAHDHIAFCCLWHPMPAVQPMAAGPPLPNAYAETDRGQPSQAPVPAGRRHAAANARAPPILT